MKTEINPQVVAIQKDILRAVLKVLPGRGLATAVALEELSSELRQEIAEPGTKLEQH